jgi:hypothetical protein
VLLAAAPFVLAIVTLQLIGSNAGPLAGPELAFLKTKLVRHAFIPGLITYAAVVLVHICICLVAIWMAVDMVRRTPGGTRYGVVAVLMAAAIIVAFVVGAQLPGIAAYELSYHGIVSAFRSMGAGLSFAGTDSGGVTPLALTMLLPAALGVMAVAAMAAAANAQLRGFPPPVGDTGEARAAYVGWIYARLRRCLYALSLVLVTSTISASLFFHLIGGFAAKAKSPEAALLARLTDYASELSIFWGCVFTLTLAAAVGLPMLLFQQRVGKRLEDLANDAAAAEESKGLTATGILSGGGEQLKFVVTCLAPLAAGPIANFAQAATMFSG